VLVTTNYVLVEKFTYPSRGQLFRFRDVHYLNGISGWRLLEHIVQQTIHLARSVLDRFSLLLTLAGQEASI
jgi:hypothetical protein